MDILSDLGVVNICLIILAAIWLIGAAAYANKLYEDCSDEQKHARAFCDPTTNLIMFIMDITIGMLWPILLIVKRIRPSKETDDAKTD